MRPTVADKRAAFRRLHEGGCFVLPNPWDAGTAVFLAGLGFKALASTSAGMAWSRARLDSEVARDDVLAHLGMLVDAVDVPINADYEHAYADDPDGVATNVALAVATGIAGLSVEDSTGDAARPLCDFTLAVARIAAARAAIDRAGGSVVLTARSEGFIAGRPDMGETLRRLKAFADAGADCLYAPGLREESQIAEVVRAVAPKPVNVLTFGLPVATLAGLGVRRVSVGGALARVAWGGFIRAAREIAEHGTFTAFVHGASGADLKRAFGRSP
ncbi:MAG: isocitrate lyase/phosphoenolpyruvate mutase family protein [Alphaproteobacteria bacterium]|nr:isocitrate lyase/phosphoenolpyruvate mutase family protein [Alphaproteobacteria bacterium]